MTLIVTELSESGIIMVGDSALSYENREGEIKMSRTRHLKNWSHT